MRERGRRSQAAREVEREIEEERRLRRARITAATGRAPEQQPDPEPTPSQEQRDDEEDLAAKRIEQQTLWVDMQVRRAMERGEFDNLPGAGKPLRLGTVHDPDWWVKNLIERERITGVLPPALALRKEDAELDGVLDRETTEDGVRRVVRDFNRRVVEARRQLQGGPPVVTPTRDEDHEVAAWRVRREDRRRRQREQLEAQEAARLEARREAQRTARAARGRRRGLWRRGR